ncbi:hypothetical protein PG984_013364 [Apiospora sp. TS-2023a]
MEPTFAITNRTYEIHIMKPEDHLQRAHWPDLMFNAKPYRCNRPGEVAHRHSPYSLFALRWDWVDQRNSRGYKLLTMQLTVATTNQPKIYHRFSHLIKSLAIRKQRTWYSMSSLSSLHQGYGWISRQPRLHFVTFNGTWAGGVLSSRKTVVSEFAKLISIHENVFETPINGVGSDIGFIDRIVGGAWAARYLAIVIDMIGLPKHGDEHLYNAIYKACHKNSSITRESSQQLLQDYEWWTDITIDALCCFDTVGSLGLPLTGLAKPLAFLGARKKRNADIVSEVASNVKFAFHCISLHETREPFISTLMRGPTVHQVSFPGSHGNLGWIEEDEGLVHAPFAWMVQQLHAHLNISFDQTQLEKRFPSYAAAKPAPHAPDRGEKAWNRTGQYMKRKVTNLPDTETDCLWFHGNITRPNAGLLAVIGKKQWSPGQANSAGVVSDLKVHIGARLRNALDDFNAVPGYTLMAPVTGRPYWERRHRVPSQWSAKSSSGAELANRLEEAEVGSLEAQLLGLPPEVVSAHHCHTHCVAC